MKSMKSMIMAVAVCAVSLPMFGQQPATASKVPPSLSFLTSKAGLKTFAIESARQANLELKSPGMVNPSWSTGRGWMSSMRAADVLAEFNSLAITVPVVNVEDYIHALATITDQMGRNLFTGNSWAQPALGKGGYTLPQMWFQFTIADHIYVKVGRSITSARARFVNENGQTVGDPINQGVVNGDLVFQSDLAGRVILELQDRDGTVYEYDLRQSEGWRINVEQVAYNGSVSFFDGVYGFTDPATIDWNVWSWNGVGQNPAFEITLTSKGLLPVGVCSSEGAVPTGYLVRAKDIPDWTPYPAAPGVKFTQLPMLPGVWYIVPVWNPNEFREPDPVIPQPTPVVIGGGGGEKG